jgi:hypothetical protein
VRYVEVCTSANHKRDDIDKVYDGYMTRTAQERREGKLEMRARDALRKRGLDVARVRTCSRALVAGKYLLTDSQRRILRRPTFTLSPRL